MKINSFLSRHRCHIVLALLLCSFAANAQDYYDQARNFAIGLTNDKNVAISPVSIKGLSNIHVYNILGGGFVISCDDSRTLPILGYSRQGAIDADNMPDNMRFWLSEYQNQINQLGNITLKELEANYTAEPKPAYPDSVAPLLVTEWNQYRYGYNSLVPYDSIMAADTNMARFEGRPTVGCGALAMGQIMRYWQFPEHGVGSHSYNLEDEYDCWRYGTVSADFANATYDYANMPYQLNTSSSPAEIEAVATLLFHCGVACDMRYNSDCQGSSGTNAAYSLNGFQRYFHYNSESQAAMQSWYSNNAWINALKNDLSKAQPIFYTGQSYNDPSEGIIASGHAFVFDGYDTNDFFHVNWGWQGACNGYFSISVLRPLTQYNFIQLQTAILNLKPERNKLPNLVMASDLELDHKNFRSDQHVSGTYSITNIGDTVGSMFFGVNIYGTNNNSYYGCVDGRRITLEPGDTILCPFSYNLGLGNGSYMALMQYSQDSFYAGIPDDVTMYYADPEHNNQVNFNVTNNSNYYNLAFFVRFADDEEISASFSDINDMFNGYEQPNSVANYIRVMSSEKMLFPTIFHNAQRQGDQIISYADAKPRGYYMPYSESNTEGYYSIEEATERENNLVSLIAQFINTISTGRESFDGDNDGTVDHITLIIKGDTGEGSILLPHTSHLSDLNIHINNQLANTCSFAFEGSENTFTEQILSQNACHALGLPDLFHRTNYTSVSPVGPYDLMAEGYANISAIYKHKVLNIIESPIQITHDGTYTIRAADQLYYIKSSIDTNQWFTIEYRNSDNPIEHSLPYSGILMGRWVDTLDLTLGNTLFNNTNIPNAYWIFRPNSTNDTVEGDLDNALFCAQKNRTVFGPNTNPQPYLTNGTPEHSFVIYDIQENGASCTFSVSFLHEGITETNESHAQVLVYPNPATHGTTITINAPSVNAQLTIFDNLGRIVLRQELSSPQQQINTSTLAHGIYTLQISDGINIHTQKVIIK